VVGVTEDCECDTKSSLAFLEIKPKTNSAGECKSFMLNAKILLCSQTYCIDDVPIVSDAFSRKFEADIIKNNVQFTRICDNLSDRLHFKENVNLNEEISTILDLWCDIQSVNTRKSEGGITVYGALLVDFIGVLENGETIFLEKPLDYEYTYPISSQSENIECQPEITVISCNFTINSPTMLEIRADLALKAAVLEKQGIELISELKLNEHKIKPKRDNCALTVYFVTGRECIWDIARIYNARVDEIIKINNVQGEFVDEGSMLLVPNI
jgi:hypothetical protein